MPEFQRQRGPITEEQIAEAEDKLGVRIPETYRSFLRSTDGGALAESYVVPESGGSGLIEEFWDINSLVQMQHAGFNEVIPHDYIAVASGGGGAACVKVTGDDTGSVWWADYDHAEEMDAEEPTEEVMTKLANDFDTFMALLDS
jgi:hypothetical protein